MIHFKYKGRPEYAKFYASELFARFGDEFRRLKISLIIPVPVHKSRLRKRGYNQAEEVARELCKLMNETGGETRGSRRTCVVPPVRVRTDILTRDKKTVAQKSLGALGRAKNIYSSMKVHYDLRDAGNILLIDDIYTTGSTLTACTLALKSAGARRIYCATVCVGIDE